MKTNRLLLLFGLLIIANKISLANEQAISWKYKTNGRIYSTPLLEDTVLYIGSLDGYFYAIDARDGSEIWNYNVGEEIRTTAAIYDSIVCFAGGNKLMGLNRKGDSLWSFKMYNGEVVNSHDAYDDFNSSPKLVDSIAYVGTEQGLVHGINVKNGTQVFSYQTQGQYTIETTPAIDNGKIYFGDWDGVFHCVDIDTEQEIWTYDTKADQTYAWVNAIQTHPVIVHDSVFFAGRSCNLYCLNTQTGGRNWKYHDPSNMWLLGGPVIEDTVVYVGSSNQRIIQGIDRRTGVRIWVTDVDYRVYGNPFVGSNYIFIGTGMEWSDNFGSLLIMDKESHHLLARFATEGQVHSSPVVKDSIVYFGCADEYIYAVNYEKLLTNKAAYTYLKDKSIVDLGELSGDEPINQEVYIYNDGEGADSVAVSCTNNKVSIEPINFILPANDSQLVSVHIDVSEMESKKYTVDIKFQSHRSVLETQLTKRYVFTISGPSANNNPIHQGEIYLAQNVPNPFVSSTIIPFRILKGGNTRLIVYNTVGKQIKVLLDQELQKGNFEIRFDARELPDGLYYYQLQTGTDILTKTMYKLAD